MWHFPLEFEKIENGETENIHEQEGFRSIRKRCEDKGYLLSKCIALKIRGILLVHYCCLK